MSHDADQLVLSVDHRDRNEVVASQPLSHFLLVVVDTHRDHVPLHDLIDPCLGSGQDQIAKRNEPPQPAPIVNHVDVVDSLSIGGLLPELLEGLGHGGLGRQRRVFGRHDRAGTVVREREQSLDVPPLGLGNHRQQVLDTFPIETFEQVHPVVGRHLLDQPRERFARNSFYKLELIRQVEVAENHRLLFRRTAG